ncbi:MAG: DUF4982 domain-containing protein [Chitinophagaceae bacterium]|nr:MAG: DUF4982 domain-containing protein [Chitinophagaceae bacterium]
MKKFPNTAFIILILFPLISFAQTKDKIAGRQIINIDRHWKFHEGRLSDAQAIDFNDAEWEIVNVPHDWRIHEQYNKNNRRLSGYLPKGIGWYRKYLDIKPEYADKRIFVSFDGVFRNSTVWVNGKEAGWHLSGYTGFVLDITKLINFHSGKNVLTVLVDNVDSNKLVRPHPQSEYGPGHEGWWYEGYGIYRHVNLIITNPVHVDTWGTFVYTKNDSRQSADVFIKTIIANQANTAHHIVVSSSIIDSRGKQMSSVSGKYTIGAGGHLEIRQETAVKNPRLWSPDHPNLYTVITKIISESKLSDVYKTPLGIRWFRFTADSGFFLNGNHLQLRGMNIHASFGGLGTALSDRANYYDIESAKKMGCNIIRSAHNDPSPSLIEACDKLGMLLWAETRYLGKDTFALATLHDMIKRDRNHPAIICWSLANNSGRNNLNLTEMLKVMNTLAKKMDPTRPTTFGCEANGDPNWTGFACVTDLMGYNGGGMNRDDKDHINYPNRKMLISEYSSGTGVRGNYRGRIAGKYKTDTLGDGRIFHTGYLYSEYDLCRSHEEEWSHIAKRPWLAGGMMWSGFEYLGESMGWPVVTSQFGVFDVARFKKDAYYYYLQEWTKKPMVHIFPSWNWDKRDSIIDVWCYSNCNEVELFLNGKSLGKKKKVPLSHIQWKVPYESGILSAKGYNANGKVIAQTEVRTARNPYQLTAKTDRSIIKANGNDLSFITIKVCDKNGTIVPHANNMIHVKVMGGKLVGVCSGSPVDHTDPASTNMHAFNGMLLAIVQGEDHPGKILIQVSSDDLKPCTLVVKAK